MRSKSVIAGVALTTAMMIGFACPSVAVADDLASGLWYFDGGHIQDAHDAGFTGQGVTIAVLDTQINPEVATLQGANLEVVDKSYCFDETGEPVSPVSTDYTAASHGTAVAALIAGTGASASGGPGTKGVAPGAEVRYSAVGTRSGDGLTATCLDEKGENRGPMGSADPLRDAIDAGADIISFSFSGHPAAETYEQLIRALALGVVIVGALPNDLDAVGWPASANGAVAVQAFDPNGEIQTHTQTGGTEQIPNTTDAVDVAAPGVGILVPGSQASWDDNSLSNGTSWATPIVAGILAVTKSKYPEATGNQLLQSMIHNTGGQVDAEPSWGDDMGYGAISLTAMLQVDAAKYPDVNPLLTSDPGLIPTVEEVEQAKTDLENQGGGASASPTSDAVAPEESSGADWMPWVIGGGVIGLLVLVGVVILAVALSRRGRNGQQPPADGTPLPGGPVDGQAGGHPDWFAPRG